MYGKLKDLPYFRKLANIKAAGLYKTERIIQPLLKRPTSK